MKRSSTNKWAEREKERAKNIPKQKENDHAFGELFNFLFTLRILYKKKDLLFVFVVVVVVFIQKKNKGSSNYLNLKLTIQN
jgi:hypothetical protein